MSLRLLYYQFCFMEVKPGRYLVPWSHVSMPFATGPFAGSRGTVGRPVSNRRLHRETGMGPVTCIIRDRQLRLYGHLARFSVNEPIHQVVSLRNNPAWRRHMGIPRKSWLGQLDQTCCEEFGMG